MLPIDEIIRSRRRSIALVVERDGRLVIRAPLRASLSQIRALVLQHAEWIRAKQQQARAEFNALPARRFVDGELFRFLGREHPLRVVPDLRPALTLDGDFRLSRAALPQARQIFERWYRRQARRIFNQRAAVYASQGGFHYTHIQVSSARTRWGSCSSKGGLSFTWRLVMAPPAIIDYVIVHELAHLRVKNHSREFWKEVESLLPGYKERRKWLKQNGRLLDL
jgi:predicted metal-dependent hydrolase